jgi:hypothetical protein
LVPRQEKLALDGKHVSMTKRSQKTCIYCGKHADTRDHIPPKSFFPTPRPSDLITVPSCLACNRGFQLDDDYAQTVLLARHDVGGHPAVKQLLPTLIRGWERPRGKRLPLSIAETARSFSIYNEAGIFVGAAPAYAVSSVRIHRFIERMVRGLFFNELGYGLPAAYNVRVVLFLERIGNLVTEIGQVLSGMPIRRLGEGAFAYCWASADDDSNATVWVLTFYDRIAFAGLTADPSKR